MNTELKQKNRRAKERRSENLTDQLLVILKEASLRPSPEETIDVIATCLNDISSQHPEISLIAENLTATNI